MGSAFFYKWSFYRRLFKYLSPLLRLSESPFVRKYGNRPLHSPIVFIIGLPRSGTTILYQLLTAMYDVLYFDNLMHLGRNSLYTSCSISHLFFGSKPHGVFTSEFGNTTEGGLHAPSEAGQLWYRWLPKENTIVTGDTISPGRQKEMRLLFSSLINRYRKPLLIKNLYTVLRIQLIRKIFPEARFIYLERDPVYVAQSILLARKANRIDPDHEWWSVGFPGYDKLLGMPEIEQVARQVSELTSLMQRELKSVPTENILTLHYETLEIDKLYNAFYRFLAAGKREGFQQETVVLNIRNEKKLDEGEFKLLEAELKHLGMVD